MLNNDQIIVSRICSTKQSRGAVFECYYFLKTKFQRLLSNIQSRYMDNHLLFSFSHGLNIVCGPFSIFAYLYVSDFEVPSITKYNFKTLDVQDINYEIVRVFVRKNFEACLRRIRTFRRFGTTLYHSRPFSVPWIQMGFIFVLLKSVHLKTRLSRKFAVKN